MAIKMKRPAQAALAIASALTLFGVSSASAAVQDIEFVNTGGSLTVGDGTVVPPIDIPPGTGGMDIEWDDATGEVAGDTTFGPITLTGVQVLGQTADIVLSIAPIGSPNVTGNIDPGTGEGTINTDVNMVMAISIPAVPISATCTLGPLDIDWDTGDPDGVPMNVDGPRPYTITLQAIDFTIPVIPSDGCDNPALPDAINQVLGLPNVGSAVLPLQEGFTPPPSSVTTSTTPSTTAAQPAAVARPRFTG